MLLRAAVALGGAASISMFGAGAASAAPGYAVPSFGTGGTVVSQFGLETPPSSQWSAGSGVAVAPNGDIYAAGSADNASGSSELYIARYLPSGVLDTTFNGTGVVYTQVSGANQTATTNGPFGGNTYLALTPAGDPVVLTNAEPSSGGPEAVVAEFTPSGALNTTFNPGGSQPGIETIQVNGSDTFPGGIAIQGDGAIVLTGSFYDPSNNNEFFAERLNADGSPDSSFGAGGVVAEQLGLNGSYSDGTGVIAQSNGDLTFSVTAEDAAGDDEFAITRLTASGQPDTSFNGTGVAYVQASTYKSPSSGALSLTATSDGGYALAGEADDTNGFALAAVRFTGSGQLDTSFGNGGVFVLPTVAPVDPSTQAFDAATSVFSQPDGKLILSGLGGELGFSSSALESVSPIVMRLNDNGTVDQSFGSGGMVSGLPSYRIDVPWTAAETLDGNLVLAGVSYSAFGSSGPAGSSSFLEEVNLDSAPTVVLASSATSVQAGTPVQFTAAAVGADFAPVSQVSWDLGSGNFGDATGTTASRAFATPGTYTIRVKATDGFGMSTIATQSLTVTAAPAPPPPPVVITPAVKKTPKLKLVKIRAAHGKVKVTLMCAFAACRIDDKLITHAKLISGRTKGLSAGGRGRRVKLASGHLRLGANRTRTFTLKLDGVGRRLLKAFHKIPAKASFKLTNTKPARTIHRRVRIH